MAWTIDYHSEVFLSGNTIEGSAQNDISILYGSVAHLADYSLNDQAARSIYVDESVVQEGKRLRDRPLARVKSNRATDNTLTVE